MKRSTGELYDAIVDSLMPTVATVAEPVLRQVLVTMARFTNPNRDQFFGPERTWRCYASVPTLAALTGCSERQLQRTLHKLTETGYVDVDDDSRGPGRPRAGQPAGPGRGRTYYLRPDRWDRRPAKTGDTLSPISETGDTGVTPFTDSEKRVTWQPKQVTPMSPLFEETGDISDSSSVETGDTGVTLTPTVVNPGVRLNPGENPRAPAGAREAETGVFSTNGHSTLPQPTLAGMLTEVPPPKKAPLCLKCWHREDEPAEPGCANPGWHLAS